ncbi:centrosomal protein of 112 kDa isoform X2 [Electrophorus electricus]|uniref:centrosomal protein of 112 kDa isoform X2 n=1 Tax=Electrophorus electricus TaxID=8005 RepID=UPI0015CFCF2D|nr:centrosomal protein of 112 kDa isoform X2 [Electrophorus electricus]
MSKEDDSLESLDSEFDHFLVDMKPYVLRRPHKSERQRCALWIKKLCDPVASGSGLRGRKNRNVYARLLLQMLRRGVLEGPFAHKPEAGTLKTLPTYMSIYFDEPLGARGLGPTTLPDWVSGELAYEDEMWSSLAKDSSSLLNAQRRRNRFSDESPTRPLSSSPLRPRQATTEDKMDGRRRPQPNSSDDSDLEVRLNSWNLGIEMRTKVLEAKHQEEKLKLQQRHDADVQKILERKNGEIEELKSLHRTKQKEADEVVRALQKKVQSLLRESQVIRQSKEEQIAELKKMADQSADSLKNDWEKKLHAAVTQMEQEKFELQKKHTDNIQELLEDTTQRLAKMEAEYRAQLQATEQTVRELETRVKQLSVEVENGNLLRQKVTQEKAELEIHIAAISAELQEANRRNTSLQRENSVQREQHEEALQKLEVKHDADISHFHQEHALSAVKASEVIEDLERLVSQLKLQLKDSEHRRQKQIRDLENKMQTETTDLQHHCERKVQALQGELDKERAEARKKASKLEDVIREREEQLSRLRDSQRQQMLQAESALDSFKKQLEISSEKAYADLKQQMERVEADLSHSKLLREKQTKEFGHQLEDLQQRYEQQIVELKLQYEQERSHLFQQHNAEKDSLVQDHQREIGSLQQQTRAAMLQHQAQTQEWRKRDAQSISELEAQVQSLREEVLAAHSQRKQQLAELGVLREEERQQAAREQEAALDRLRTEMERARLDLEKIHAAERDLAQEKANSRLKQLEKEYSQKLAKSAQAMTELQTALCSVKEESKQRQQAQQRQLEETQAHWDEERRQLSRDAERASKALQERVEALQRQLHAAEKLLLSRDLEFQEQITRIRQQYEMKIKGLMPVELRQELEDTITSLKSQVNFLQKRASVLQEDLDTCRSKR